MSRRASSAALLALGLTACAHYAPAPPHPERFAAAFDARVLDEQPPGAAWSDAELLAAAVKRNPQIVEARAKYATALAAARAARAPPGPSLTLTAEYADESPHWGYSGASDLPLDYGARRGARITTAELQALQAFYDYGEAVWSARTDLEKARADLDAAQGEAALAAEAVEVRRRRADLLESRVRAGQDARPLVLAARSELSAATARLNAANGRRAAALGAIAKAVGVGAPAVATLTLAPPPARPWSREALPGWRRDAAASRRDVLRAVADYDIAEQALRLQVASQYPAVSLGPAYNYDHGVTKLPFSLALALPPWDLNRGAIAQAEAARAAAGRSLELAQAAALAAVDSAVTALRTASDDLRRTEDYDLPLARRVAAAAARSARAGETDRVDQLAAAGAELDSELALNDARHALAGATADLEDALRRSFDPAETAVIEKALTDVGRAR